MTSPSTERCVPTEQEIALWLLQLLENPQRFPLGLEGDENAGLRPLEAFANTYVLEIVDAWYEVSGHKGTEFALTFFESLKAPNPDSVLLPATGVRLWEAGNPLDPLQVPPADRIPLSEAIELMHQWISGWKPIAPGASPWTTVGESITASLWEPHGDFIVENVWSSALESISVTLVGGVADKLGRFFEDAVHDVVFASIHKCTISYLTTFFTRIPDLGVFHSGAHLWRGGFVPSFDNKTWRLHTGELAEVVWERTM